MVDHLNTHNPTGFYRFFPPDQAHAYLDRLEFHSVPKNGSWLNMPEIEIGIPNLTAHLFVFYFAMLSAITPPVAVAVAVGSRIADADFMQTGKQALRIGAPGFLIPFALVANPELVFWSFPMTLVVSVVVFVGVVSLVATTVGYDGRNDLRWGFRLGYLPLSFGAMYGPSIVVQIAAATIALAGLGLAQVGCLPRFANPAKE